ncbi:hypothetical protein DSO57_1012505 [Entomophthora muscae]|uniref:Uncharacterized protein n=1 Tax=Entomophthora muscae TaxID=34485 RepID=A0ACC2T608_9FUNG|nr:hypothetical protein DSO57_1012505 [Entomophthora muscae]
MVNSGIHNRRQASVPNPPPSKPMPDPCIAMLTDQVATFLDKIEYLRQRLSDPDDSSSESDDKGEAEVTGTLTHPDLVIALYVMAIVFPGVAWPKPRLLAAIVDLNLMIDCKWVVAHEIGSEWGADAPHPIFPSLTCWSTNPDLKGGQVTA